MPNEGDISVLEATPAETWTALKADPSAIMVDVRTQPEWAYVGLTDLSSLGKNTLLIEWASFPTMAKNEKFAESLFAHIGDTPPSSIYFLCRSGVRSLRAATLISELDRTIKCVNITGGFEGDKDAQGHRGTVNGWKKAGLPWQQD